MNKKPVIIITDQQTFEFYRALPLWDEEVKIYAFADSPHHSKPLHADLVLIDCGFDDEKSLNLLREIKLNNHGTPVMLITDAGSEETAIAAFRIGARDYIKKPVSLMELRDTVTKFLLIKREDSWGKRRHFHADRVANTAKSPGMVNNDLPANLLRVIRFVNENFSQPVSIDQLAKEAALCKSHFCREFKRATGMTPMYFLSIMRVKRSKELLRKKMPVSAVAFKVGFNDLTSFNRHFKKFTGMTPTAYRNSFQQGL